MYVYVYLITWSYLQVYAHVPLYMYNIMPQVSSIQQEFENIQSRGIHHPNLVQYLAMNHTYHEDDNKISVEVINNPATYTCTL